MPDNEKQYRLVECTNCRQKLRLTVSPKNYGKEVRVTCTTCQSVFLTTIASHEIEEVPAEAVIDEAAEAEKSLLESLKNEFSEAVSESIESGLESPRVREAAKKLNKAGYDLGLILGARIDVAKREDGTADAAGPITPKIKFVKNGEVVSEAFSTEDEQWLKNLDEGFRNNGHS